MCRNSLLCTYQAQIMEEPTGTADVPAIKGTLKIWLLKRSIVNGVPEIELFELDSDSTPFHTQWYKSESG